MTEPVTTISVVLGDDGLYHDWKPEENEKGWNVSKCGAVLTGPGVHSSIATLTCLRCACNHVPPSCGHPGARNTICPGQSELSGFKIPCRCCERCETNCANDV